MNHKELVQFGANWLLKKAPNSYLKCQYAVTEFVFAGSESPDIFGIRSGQTVLIEVKVSRSDFLRDKLKPHRKNQSDALGLYRYFLAPKGMIKIEEVGDWGLLEVVDGKINVVKKSKKFQPHRNAEMNLMYSILRRSIKSGILFKK